MHDYLPHETVAVTSTSQIPYAACSSFRANLTALPDLELHYSLAVTARLFQSRESIFGRTPTEFDQILRVKKAVEPYVNLWGTARDWMESHEAWTKGSFLSIDAEALEAEVER